jgi:hypothetical protein
MKTLIVVSAMLAMVGCARPTPVFPDRAAAHDINLRSCIDRSVYWQEKESRVKDFYMEMK